MLCLAANSVSRLQLPARARRKANGPGARSQLVKLRCMDALSMRMQVTVLPDPGECWASLHLEIALNIKSLLIPDHPTTPKSGWRVRSGHARNWTSAWGIFDIGDQSLGNATEDDPSSPAQVQPRRNHLGAGPSPSPGSSAQLSTFNGPLAARFTHQSARKRAPLLVRVQLNPPLSLTLQTCARHRWQRSFWEWRSNDNALERLGGDKDYRSYWRGETAMRKRKKRQRCKAGAILEAFKVPACPWGHVSGGSPRDSDHDENRRATQQS